MTEMYPEPGPYEPPDLTGIDFSLPPEEELSLRLEGLVHQHTIYVTKAHEGLTKLASISSGRTNETLTNTLDAVQEATKLHETVLWAIAMGQSGLSKEKINKILWQKAQNDQPKKKGK